MGHPREVRIRYLSSGFWNVVPVQILRVWDKSLSMDANGVYVPMYNHDDAPVASVKWRLREPA
uniref:Uncharacterized protein n=1 Tax=Leersia perrieri TaxID=77586 RepID=A0A0D9V8T9_9ORYZ